MNKKVKSTKRLRKASAKRGSLLQQVSRIEQRDEKADSTRLDRARITTSVGYGRISPRPARPMPGAQLTIMQVVEGSTFHTTTGLVGDLILAQQLAGVAVSLAFALSDFANAGTFTAAFDQYRFEKVKVHLVSSVSEVNYATASTAPPAVPPLAVVVDYDDSNALANFQAALQYDNIQLLAPYQSCSIEFLPKFAPTVWNSGAASGFSTKSCIEEWIDVASPQVPFFGIKAWVDADGAPTGHQSWRVFAEYFVSFKNVR